MSHPQQQSDPYPAQQRQTAVWEYHVETFNMSERWSAKRQQQEAQAFTARLNQIGAEGWEMIAYESVPLTGAFTGTVKGYAYLLFLQAPALGRPRADGW